MAVAPLSVHSFFELLKSSLDDARKRIGAGHALVPLEPWLNKEDAEQLLSADTTGTVTVTGRGQLMVTAAGRQVPVLRVAVYPLPGELLTVGRTSKSDLLVDQPTVSRTHAELTRKGANFQVTDKGSYNGTMVNHRMLDPHEVAALRDGDVIVFGEAQLVFGSIEHLAHLVHGSRTATRV